jgi:hypothetical protein
VRSSARTAFSGIDVGGPGNDNLSVFYHNTFVHPQRPWCASTPYVVPVILESSLMLPVREVLSSDLPKRK